MKAKNYNIVDFILNESFQRYVLSKNQEDSKYWTEWSTENPEAVAVFDEAKSLISFIASKKALPKHSSISEEVFGKLLSKIESEKNQEQGKNIRRFISPFWYVAASIIVLIGIFSFFDISNLFFSGSQTSQSLEIIVPKGQRSQVLLPDGTKVWLNAGTIFKYPSNFLKHGREVYLEGEAFFNVTHNKRMPFLVHIKNNLTIKVLGTEFNVKCYNEDRNVETTLIKGAIVFWQRDKGNKVLKEVNLIPKEKVTYDKSMQKMTVTKLDIPASSVTTTTAYQKNIAVTHTDNTEDVENDKIEALTSWKDDALIFQDETFEDISIKMGRWFGISITINDENLKQERFTGKFINKESVYQILDIINRSEPIQYTRKNKELIISRQKRK